VTVQGYYRKDNVITMRLRCWTLVMNKNQKALSPNASAKSVYFFNMLGGLINATFYMLLLMVVSRLKGEYDAGVFAIGYAIATLMWSIASFETSVYQATDIQEVYQFGHYMALKLMVCLAMMLISLCIAVVRGGTAYEMAVIVLLCLFKAIDAFSDIFYGQFQRYGRLDISGKSLSARILLSMMALTLVLVFGGSLITALIGACLCEIAWIVGYEMRLMAPLRAVRPLFDGQKIKQLAAECFPLAVGVFLLTFLINLPKYALDAYYEVELQAAFSALFMPAAIINLLSLFVFRPSLTRLSAVWARGEKQEFFRRMVKFIIVIAGLTVSAMAFAWLAGTQVLGFIYGVELRAYRAALVIIMLGGGFSALTVFCNNMLTIMRRQRLVMLGNVFSAVCALLICVPLVKWNAMTGAAMLYAISMLLSALLEFGAVLWFSKKKRTE